jgi:hypothetical protein
MVNLALQTLLTLTGSPGIDFPAACVVIRVDDLIYFAEYKGGKLITNLTGS